MVVATRPECSLQAEVKNRLAEVAKNQAAVGVLQEEGAVENHRLRMAHRVMSHPVRTLPVRASHRAASKNCPPAKAI